MARGSVKLDATDVLWPPLAVAFRELSGGWWVETDCTLTVNFFEAGFAGAYFVGRRLGTLCRGTLTVELATAAAALPAIFSRWADKIVRHDVSARIREGDLAAVPAPQRGIFGAATRKQRQAAFKRGGAAPRCVKLAMAMKATGPSGAKRAWRNTHRWDMAKIVKRYAALVDTDADVVMRDYIVPQMVERGDSAAAIKEFGDQVRFAPSKGFRCAWRTKQEGIFCPFGGREDGARACAAEQGVEYDEAMTPASVWAATPPARPCAPPG